MEQYIKKSTLVAALESLRCITYTNFDDGVNATVQTLLEMLDTFDVKEVDLEKEIKEQSDKYYSQCEKKLQEMDDDDDNDLSFLSLDNYAKYFFELGLKSKGE